MKFEQGQDLCHNELHVDRTYRKRTKRGNCLGRFRIAFHVVYSTLQYADSTVISLWRGALVRLFFRMLPVSYHTSLPRLARARGSVTVHPGVLAVYTKSCYGKRSPLHQLRVGHKWPLIRFDNVAVRSTVDGCIFVPCVLEYLNGDKCVKVRTPFRSLPYGPNAYRQNRAVTAKRRVVRRRGVVSTFWHTIDVL